MRRNLGLGTDSPIAMKFRLSRGALALIFVVLAGTSLFVSLFPEAPASPLTSDDGWIVRGSPDKLILLAFPASATYLRKSVLESTALSVHRSWTPDRGVQDFELISPPFKTTPAMSIVVTGTTRTTNGGSSAYLS